MPSHTALILEQKGQPLQAKSLPIPPAVHCSAVVKVLATPISGLAKAVFEGKMPIPLRSPVTPSSSAIARIESVGSDATLLRNGQLVFVDFWIRSRDDEDESILQGYMGGNETLEAAWSNGAFAEYAVVPLENIWTLDEYLLINRLQYSFADLAFLGTVSIPMAGLLDIDTRPGDTVIIAPATGYFGGSTVNAAIALGAKVIACGRNESKLSQMAKTFEPSGRFTYVLMSGEAEKDTVAIKAKCSSAKGAEKYVDFSPPQAQGSTHIQACMAALRPYGKMVIMGAIFGDFSVQYFSTMRANLRTQGRYMFDRNHAQTAINLLGTGQLVLGDRPMGGIKVERFKLQDHEKALASAEKGHSWGYMAVFEP